MKRKYVIGALATATLLTGACGGGGASAEDYDAVRTAFGSAMSVSGDATESIDIPDGEIDCMAKARDESVAEFATALKEDAGSDISDEESAQMFDCLSSDSFRKMMEPTFAGPDAAAAGYDSDCMLDVMAGQFDKWKEAGGKADDLATIFGADAQSQTADCLTAGG